jgi:hypothetical protein
MVSYGAVIFWGQGSGSDNTTRALTPAEPTGMRGVGETRDDPDSVQVDGAVPGVSPIGRRFVLAQLRRANHRFVSSPS